MDERRDRFRRHHDAYRSAVVNEPRGSDAIVGALLVDPHRPDCDFGVIFFGRSGKTSCLPTPRRRPPHPSRVALNSQGHPLVDHIELFCPTGTAGAHSKNFVLCPGKAYDRSPCGTGTSAKLACLAADGKLAEGVPWVQESLIGSTFTARYRWHDRAKG